MHAVLSLLISLTFAAGEPRNRSYLFEGCEHSLVLTHAPILDTNLRSKLLQSADQTMDIGVNDPIRGGWMSDWSLVALGRYRLLGLGREEIESRARLRLEKFLNYGRSHGLSVPSQTLPLPGEAPEVDLAAEDFPTKYNLSYWQAISKKFGLGEMRLVSYSTSLGDAYRLATIAGTEAQMAEILIHMLRTSSGYQLHGELARNQDNIALLVVAKIRLAQFYFGDEHRYDYNQAFDAIEALKNVNGFYKAEAAQILYDFAVDITSESFLRHVVSFGSPHFGSTSNERYQNAKRIFGRLALFALRSTGRVIETQAIDSVRWNFITRISDPKVRDQIVRLSRAIMKDNPSFQEVEEIKFALAACEEKDEMRKVAEELWTQYREPALAQLAFDLFILMNDFRKAREIYRWYVAELTPVLTDFTYLRMLIDLDDEDLWRAHNERLAKNPHADKTQVEDRITYLREKKNNVNQEKNNVNQEKNNPNDDPLHPFASNAWEEWRKIQQKVAQLKAALDADPTLRSRLMAKAKAAKIAKNYSLAWQYSYEALDTNGIREIADFYLEQGDGLNAWTMYMAIAAIGM